VKQIECGHCAASESDPTLSLLKTLNAGKTPRFLGFRSFE
jgi:hypothetical protein